MDWWLASAMFLAASEVLLGRPGRAVEIETRIAERTEASSHPFSKAAGWSFMAFSAAVRGDPMAASAHLVPARKISDYYGFHECTGWGKQFGGWADFRFGERARGMAEMSEAIEELPAVGSSMMSRRRLALLAEAQTELGIYDAPETTVARALHEKEHTSEPWCEAEVYRVAAEVILRRPGGDLAVADKRLRQAIEDPSPSYCGTRVAVTKRGRFSPRSTAGSPRARHGGPEGSEDAAREAFVTRVQMAQLAALR
jgi:hypothetical protein